jgi:NNP family nitrate/nitrite transporter-like MFS transporter
MQRTLTGATIGFFVGFASVSLFGPTAQLLDEGMRMTSFQLALLVAMPSLSGSLLRIPFGAWVDADGGRRPFLILLGLSLIGMLGVTLLLGLVGQPNLSVAHYPLLVVCALLSGCGIATFSVGIGQVSYWYPPARQGWALGAFAGFGNIAPGLFSLLIPLAIGAVSITGTYLIWSGVVVAGLLIYARLTADAPYFQFRKRGHGPTEARREAARSGQELFPAGGTWSGLARAARIPGTWVLVFLYFTSFGGFLALTAWFPTFWQSYFGYSITLAGALTMTYSVLASLIRVPAGVLADRIGGVRTGSRR